MKLNCEFCGAIINDYDEKCSNCGASNSHLKISTNPRTLVELKKWYEDMKLPPMNVTRFFIGQDNKEAKAYGIYRHPETGVYIVYKNTSDGKRIVAYEGGDEAYAVNEIYVKLKSIIAIMKAKKKI